MCLAHKSAIAVLTPQSNLALDGPLEKFTKALTSDLETMMILTRWSSWGLAHSLVGGVIMFRIKTKSCAPQRDGTQ
jgi:hypothetical protein